MPFDLLCPWLTAPQRSRPNTQAPFCSPGILQIFPGAGAEWGAGSAVLCELLGAGGGRVPPQPPTSIPASSCQQPNTPLGTQMPRKCQG